jgi:uncharacterized protein YqcC (DUF446 family)
MTPDSQSASLAFHKMIFEIWPYGKVWPRFNNLMFKRPACHETISLPDVVCVAFLPQRAHLLEANSTMPVALGTAKF